MKIKDIWKRYKKNDWFIELLKAEEKAEKFEKIAKSYERQSKESIPRREHLANLELKVRRLRRQVRQMQLDLEWKNRMMYATNLIVNCTGCEAGGPFAPKELTEEKVKAVELIADRLRTWWDSHNWRVKMGKVKS